MAGKSRKGRGGSIATFISDRSGFRFPMSESVREPGTGYLIHNSESDGIWNLVDHPLNHVQRYARHGDPFPVDNARPEQSFTGSTQLSQLQLENEDFLETENGKILTI